MDYILTNSIKYKCYDSTLSSSKQKSIRVIGFDTESYDDGSCFMYATSLGDIWSPDDFPACLFSRRYESQHFVCYNLAYDEGSIVQFLPIANLNELWRSGKTVYNEYTVKIIPRKMLSITRKKKTATFWDMLNFFGGSLDNNAKKYLGKHKKEIETKTFTKKFVEKNFDRIGEYCVYDAVLVQELGELIIKKFEQFGINPRRLYSTAYISYTYFRKNCNYITVKRFWNEDKKLLDYALMSYNGGKFEVTEKGTGMFYEYDIVSAYPYEIANLIDLTYARVYWQREIIHDAQYAFLNVIVDIPIDVHSPIAVKKKSVNTYPCGKFNKVITLSEYNYLVSHNVNVEIINAVWLCISKPSYPYRQRITELVKLKQQYKHEGNELDEHTVKIFLNSLYGKFCQIIHTHDEHIASTCWNPIYASIITANTRVKVTQYQQLHPEIIAVHTDSLISKKKLNFSDSDRLGDFTPKKSGHGVMLGTGIYQIGDKTKFRGFESKTKLSDMINVDSSVIKIDSLRKYGWRECIFHNWGKEYINRFVPDIKELTCNFDTKRLWDDDYRSFIEVNQRNVFSLPLFVDL